MASSERPDTNLYIHDPWPDGGDENDQPPDDSTTFDRDDSFDDDDNEYDVFDPVETYDTIEQKWTWAGPTQDMCAAGCWAPDDPFAPLLPEDSVGSFGLSSSNLRNDFILPEHQNDILSDFRSSPVQVAGVQNATEAFAVAMLQEGQPLAVDTDPLMGNQTTTKWIGYRAPEHPDNRSLMFMARSPLCQWHPSTRVVLDKRWDTHNKDWYCKSLPQQAAGCPIKDAVLYAPR